MTYPAQDNQDVHFCPAAQQALDPDEAATEQMLVPIAVEALFPTPALDYDLHLWADAMASAVLYRNKGAPFTRADIDQLANADVQTLYLSLDDHVCYRRHLHERFIDNNDVSPVLRYKTLKGLNRRVFDAAMQGRNLNRLVRVADSHAARLTEIICDRDFVLDDLFGLMDHDFYTYTHATNVCVYSVSLAASLGMTDRTELVSIGIGALLHDIGKRCIPASVLNKPGKLNAEEWDLIQLHPLNAFDELMARADVSWDTLMMVYQHHERLNGSGYPLGLDGDEVHPWARICAIADVFDALTSERPYREPDSVSSVCEFFETRAGKEFDREMVSCLISLVK